MHSQCAQLHIEPQLQSWSHWSPRQLVQQQCPASSVKVVSIADTVRGLVIVVAAFRISLGHAARLYRFTKNMRPAA